MKQACTLILICLSSYTMHLDLQTCCRMKWRPPNIVLCTYRPQLPAWAACICWREHLWQANIYQGTGMGITGSTSFAQGVLCTWQMVSAGQVIDWYVLMHCFRYSVLPMISLSGMIHCSIIEGSFDTESFLSFISELLEYMSPYPGPNSVIIMDNCCIHKAPQISKMICSQLALLI